MADVNRTPKFMDYIAGAIFTNGLASVAIYLVLFEPSSSWLSYHFGVSPRV